MTTQTKMNDLMKVQRKAWKASHPNIKVFSFPLHGVTVAIRRTGERMGEFTIAIMGKDETKFRRKVGEWYALARMVDGRTMPTRLYRHTSADEDVILHDAATYIADALG